MNLIFAKRVNKNVSTSFRASLYIGWHEKKWLGIVKNVHIHLQSNKFEMNAIFFYFVSS